MTAITSQTPALFTLHTVTVGGYTRWVSSKQPKPGRIPALSSAAADAALFTAEEAAEFAARTAFELTRVPAEPTAASPAPLSARRTKMTATERRIAGERRVYRRLIRFLLRDGGMISINYGDGWDPDLRCLTDIKTLFHWFLQTDEMTLLWRDRERNLIGGFYLVYGNSPDELIADYTANAQCEAAAEHAYNERA